MKPCPVSFILLYDTRIEMVDIIFSEIGHVEKDKIFPCAESVQVDLVEFVCEWWSPEYKKNDKWFKFYLKVLSYRLIG